jgi:hypothetical protein
LYRFVAAFMVTLHAPTATSKIRRSEDPKEAREGSDGRRQFDASFTAHFDGLCWLAGRAKRGPPAAAEFRDLLRIF